MSPDGGALLYKLSESPNTVHLVDVSSDRPGDPVTLTVDTSWSTQFEFADDSSAAVIETREELYFVDLSAKASVAAELIARDDAGDYFGASLSPDGRYLSYGEYGTGVDSHWFARLRPTLGHPYLVAEADEFVAVW